MSFKLQITNYANFHYGKKEHFNYTCLKKKKKQIFTLETLLQECPSAHTFSSYSHLPYFLPFPSTPPLALSALAWSFCIPQIQRTPLLKSDHEPFHPISKRNNNFQKALLTLPFLRDMFVLNLRLHDLTFGTTICERAMGIHHGLTFSYISHTIHLGKCLLHGGDYFLNQDLICVTR